jgi:hypothetical protein
MSLLTLRLSSIGSVGVIVGAALLASSSVALDAETPPGILIWDPPYMTVTSADALQADLGALGETAVIVHDLFAYSSDLSGHEIVMGVVGITPDTHLLTAAEGDALTAYVQNGGLLYLEGADVFDYDPDFQDGYDIRGVFGLNPGNDGESVFNDDVVGTGLLAAGGFDFDYLGERSFLDELNPATATAILRKKGNSDILAVFHGYGLGRAVGISCEYGGLYDFPDASRGPLEPASGPATLIMRQQFLASVLDLLRGGGVVVGVPDAGPGGFALHPAAPNPVRLATAIRYDLPRDARVRLSIHDVHGRLVRTLVDQRKDGGPHVAKWDVRDDGGGRVAPGVYFYALRGGEKPLGGRVVVLR